MTLADIIHLVSGDFPRIIIHRDMVAEQAPYTRVYIIRSRVYPDHLHDAVLIVLNFQARYFGLCSVMYVIGSLGSMLSVSKP